MHFFGKKVRAGKTKKGETIHIPGYDKEEKLKKILDKGEIEIEETLISQLRKEIQ